MPVGGTVVEDILNEVSPHSGMYRQWTGSASPAGVRNRCHAVRKAGQRRVLVKDKGAVPQSTKFSVRLPCHLAHQGVCASADDLNYNLILKLEDAIGYFFIKTWKRLYFRIAFAKDGTDHHLFVFFAYRRTRRPMVHITHGFAKLEFDVDAQILNFAERTDRRALAWHSSFSLAKLLVHCGWDVDLVIHVHRVPLVHRCGPLQVAENAFAEDGDVLWPKLKRPPKKRDRELDTMEPKPSKKTRALPGGGVKYLRPKVGPAKAHYPKVLKDVDASDVDKDEVMSCDEGSDTSESSSLNNSSVSGAPYSPSGADLDAPRGSDEAIGLGWEVAPEMPVAPRTPITAPVAPDSAPPGVGDAVGDGLAEIGEPEGRSARGALLAVSLTFTVKFILPCVTIWALARKYEEVSTLRRGIIGPQREAGFTAMAEHCQLCCCKCHSEFLLEWAVLSTYKAPKLAC